MIWSISVPEDAVIVESQVGDHFEKLTITYQNCHNCHSYSSKIKIVVIVHCHVNIITAMSLGRDDFYKTFRTRNQKRRLPKETLWSIW